MPKRSARSFTWRSDSSALTYNVVSPWSAIAPIACKSSVDLPMPGSPPTKMSAPCTKPPPSTRSSSAMPDDRRGSSPIATSASRVLFTLGPATSRFCDLAVTSSTKVFQAPQALQRPSHFCSVCPQA
jgi:hypothetical protein